MADDRKATGAMQPGVDVSLNSAGPAATPPSLAAKPKPPTGGDKKE